MMLQHILINSGYILMLAAFVARDILWLRVLLICAQSFIAAFGWFSGYPVMFFWNSLFVALNGIQVALLLRERRPIRLEPGLESIYQQVFSSMKRREFLYFWEMGDPRDALNSQLIRRGEQQDDLMLVLDGHVQVRTDGRVLARLGRGQFIAEMSFLTGEPASADVFADGAVKYLSWPQEKLRHLKQLNPHLLILVQHILGRDLAGKIKAAAA